MQYGTVNMFVFFIFMLYIVHLHTITKDVPWISDCWVLYELVVIVGIKESRGRGCHVFASTPLESFFSRTLKKFSCVRILMSGRIHKFLIRGTESCSAE